MISPVGRPAASTTKRRDEIMLDPPMPRNPLSVLIRIILGL